MRRVDFTRILAPMPTRGNTPVTIRLPQRMHKRLRWLARGGKWTGVSPMLRQMIVGILDGDFEAVTQWLNRAGKVFQEEAQTNFLQELTPGNDPVRGTRSGGESGVTRRGKRGRPGGT